MIVRKALIPAAGLGTRMHPVSRFVPKELLPLGTRPALEHVIAEAVAAGISEIAVVVSPHKPLLLRYLDWLAGEEPYRGIRFERVSQPEPRGLGDAMMHSRTFVAGEPFALLLPDNVSLAPDSGLGAMLDLFEATGRDVVGIIELDHTLSGTFGNCGLFEGEPDRAGVLRVTRIAATSGGVLEVPPGTRVRRRCGRYICRPRVLDRLDALRARATGELSEVPAYQEIAAEGGLLGQLLPPPLFDVGNPRGYLAASAWLHTHPRDAGAHP